MPVVAAESAIEAAAYAALAAGVTLAPVYQHVPEDTPPPLVIVAGIDGDPEPLAAKGDDDDVKAALTIVSLVEGEARKPLFAIEAEVKAALRDLRVTRDGWELSFVYAGRDDGGLLENGRTYPASLRFTVFALAAD